MITKTLLLTAAMAAGAALSGMAQTVYSVNAVGYVNLAIPQGWSMIANPLNTTNNTIQALLAGTTPDFSQLYKWDGTQYAPASYAFGAWDNPNYTLNPGEGCFFYAPTAFTNTFVGEVMQGALTNAIPVGWSIRSSTVPQAGTAEELSLTGALNDFDALYKFNNASSAYEPWTYAFGSWDKTGSPTLNVGEAFWINATQPTKWVRNFSVNTP